MWIFFSTLFLFFFTIITTFLAILTASTSQALHPDELNALGEIATTLGIKRLNLSDGDPCFSRTLNIGFVSDEMKNTIACDCSFNNNMTCHITELTLVNLTLVGKVPPELAKLRHLRST
ncbi:BnaA07g07700D [Brassica napus]|uniref:BnaA07g07700D protein n=1 Tax=Brassica napus TaxID=3708 RepID=A0A078I0U8_BRANA|nr:BnaA07g07700D [Brassica napus]